MPITNQGEEVRALIDMERNGVLSTLSKRFRGWPFGSITPFTTSVSGEPLILISEIAEHTRNLRHDARTSLLVQDSRALEDPQAGARVTLIGYAVPVAGPYIDDARARYLKQFPNSAGYFDAHDFSLFRIQITDVRFIGGFGEIYWLKGEEVVDSARNSGIDPLAPHIASICDHMNQDHADALSLYGAAYAGLNSESARMIHVDGHGFDMVAQEQGNHRHLRIDFASPVTTTDEVRAAMIDLVKRAREIVAHEPR
jgi:putative heme iron utilization protein